MSDSAANGSYHHNAPDASAMPGERSRFAATSFRNLMSRMQKADAAEVPDFQDIAEIAPVAVDPVVIENIVLPDEPQPEKLPDEEEDLPALLNGRFEDNFTYVPEPGEVIAAPDTEDEEESVRREMAERAIQIELENIWRLLLAKPTVDDTSQYLREAADIHGNDMDFMALSAEHDLSLVAGSIAASGEFVVPEDDFMPEELDDPDELAQLLIGLMAAGSGSGQPQERALASDTLLRLLPRLKTQTTELIARRLTLMDYPSPLLVARLLRDERPEIMGPLLEDCVTISDKDLLAAINKAEPAMLRLIARRRRVSQVVCEALITSGDPSTVLTLVRNAAAEISTDGFRTLLRLCASNQELLAPLATRQDISAAFAFDLFWLSPPQLRRFIMSRHLTDSEALYRILKITVAANRDSRDPATPINQHALMDALDRTTRGHLGVACEELAELLQLSTSTVTRILNDVSGEALVVMLKAAGYPRSAVTGLLKRMQEATIPIISVDRDISELQIMFEILSFNKARVLIVYWDWAEGKLGPYMLPLGDSSDDTLET